MSLRSRVEKTVAAYHVSKCVRHISAILLAQNDYCSQNIYLQFMKYLRSLILPITIIQIKARRRVSFVKINAPFSRRDCDLAYQLVKGEASKLGYFHILFSLLFSLFARSKVNFAASPRKKGGKAKTG